MPDEKKNYFGLLISIVGIIGSLFVFLNYRFQNNLFPSSLKKQEEITNNDLQEENNGYQEVIVNKEIINNYSFFDKTIINLLIFLLIFLITVYLVYFFPLSPVVINNQKNTVKLNEKKDDFEKSILRKIGDFEGRRSFERENYFYFYDENKYDVEKNNNHIAGGGGGNNEKLSLLTRIDDLTKNCGFYFKLLTEKKEEFNFNKYKGNIIAIQDKKEYPCSNLLTIRFSKELSELNTNYENFLKKITESNNKKIEYRKSEDASQEVKDIFSRKKIMYTYQKNFEFFQGKTDFFNSHNIIAFLLSSGIFFSSFYILFSVLYFFYALIYLLFFLNKEEIKEEEKENKFLIAFYQTLRAITFFNLHGFSKIIPILCFSGVFVFGGVIFFGKNIFLIPIIHDISNKKERKTMNFYHYSNVFLKKLLKGEKARISIDDYYQYPYVSLEEKKLPDPNISVPNVYVVKKVFSVGETK